MNRSEQKSINELKYNERLLQQNVNKLYAVCNSLYKEIQEIKKFVNFKYTDDLSESNQTNVSNLEKSFSVLDNLTDNTTARKLKIIEN